METRGTWTDLIVGVGLQIGELFNQAMETYKPGIFNVLNRVDPGQIGQRNVTGKTGAGKLKKFNDGEDVPGTRRYKTYTTSVAYTDYGEFVEVTKNTIEDRGPEFEADLNEVSDISISANYSQDESGVQLFNGGFATTVSVNGYDMTWYNDGKPLFSTIHPTVVPGASTQSNASSTSIPYSYDNMEVMQIALTKQNLDDGKAMQMRGKTLMLLPTDLRREAIENTQSVLDPTTAENAINVYRNGMNADFVTTRFLDSDQGGSATAWYSIMQGAHKLNHELRQAPRMGQSVNGKNFVTTFTVNARWAESAVEWKRTWASKGNNSSYSS